MAIALKQCASRIWLGIPIHKSGTASILYVCTAHLVQIVLMVMYQSAIGSTALLSLQQSVHMVDGKVPYEAAVILLVSTTLAICGATLKLGKIRFLMFAPQQFFLGVMAWGGWIAVWHGAYLDGTPIPWPHIATDQIAWTAIFFIHMNAILRRTREP